MNHWKENSKKKFSLNLRGFITNPKDLEKAEEEAWKTARMIIADVISTRNQSWVESWVIVWVIVLWVIFWVALNLHHGDKYITRTNLILVINVQLVTAACHYTHCRVNIF